MYVYLCTPYGHIHKSREIWEICGNVWSLTLAAGLGLRSNSGVLDSFSPVSLRRASGLLVPISRRRISGLFVRPISGGLLAEVGEALSFLKKLLMPAAILQINHFKTKLEWDYFNFWVNKLDIILKSILTLRVLMNRSRYSARKSRYPSRSIYIGAKAKTTSLPDGFIENPI